MTQAFTDGSTTLVIESNLTLPMNAPIVASVHTSQKLWWSPLTISAPNLRPIIPIWLLELELVLTFVGEFIPLPKIRNFGGYWDGMVGEVRVPA